ncbi:UrcA family protein [Sphingomonas sp. RP10(2022)]|uniref:UrcA family protein n=1 Tax=Sphingomonas liriopis TaxID=2949094 RepID=A0A9X2KS98_9SPHN|nr:UrcA family protein [Sphingomonas liriopis]MCP3736511.1 UrcA family protein [Sphingomonas liriopis]
MKNPTHAAVAAIALSCLSAGSALAAPMDARREAVSMRVSHVGLDLRTAAGRTRFDARVRRAANFACVPVGGSVEQRMDAQRCIKEMVDDAAVQLAARFRDDGTQLASSR